MASFYIKTNRTFTFIRKWAWVFTLLVAIGGLWVPKLGLFVLPIMLSLTVVAFFKGRYWCGNFCPHGSLYDALMMHLSLNKRIPKFFRSKIVGVLFFAWFGFSLTRKFMKVIPTFGSDQFLDKLGFIFVSSYLMVLIVGGTLSLFISPRTWCNFCPMGILQTLSYKLGKLLGVNKSTDEKVTVASKDMCHSCGKCSRVCPMQLVPYLEFSDKNQFDNVRCIRCATCVKNCPAGILSLNNETNAEDIRINTDNTGYEERKKIVARIKDITDLNQDVTQYTFKFEEPKKVDYKAGQFILVKIQDNPKMYRAYSISSYNEDGTELSVTVKKLKDGYGSEIIEKGFKVGDRVELEGPMGRELIVDKNAEKVLLIAGGIGITPFLPIARDLLESENNIKEVKLVYGVNYENEFIYDDEFKKLEYENPKFEYVKVVAFDEKWKGRKGFVTNVIREMNLKDYKVYMCGPEPMINACLKVLKEQEVKEENIFRESA